MRGKPHVSCGNWTAGDMCPFLKGIVTTQLQLLFPCTYYTSLLLLHCLIMRSEKHTCLWKLSYFKILTQWNKKWKHCKGKTEYLEKPNLAHRTIALSPLVFGNEYLYPKLSKWLWGIWNFCASFHQFVSILINQSHLAVHVFLTVWAPAWLEYVRKE